MPIEQGLCLGFLGLFQVLLRFCAPEFHRVLLSLRALVCAGLLFAKLVEIYNGAHGVLYYHPYVAKPVFYSDRQRKGRPEGRPKMC